MRLRVGQAEQRERKSRGATFVALTLALAMTPMAALAAGEPADPVPIRKDAPKYPPGAERRGITGWVIVEFAVDGRGNVIFPKIVEGSPPGVFDSVALRAVANWRYQPTGSDSEALQVKMRFELDK